jgi:sulfur-oxidizing protein SoxB
MARWASLLENKRREKPVMLIDGGDFCSAGNLREQEIKDKYFFEALGLLRYDALGVAEVDILYGRKKLEEKAKRLPLVSANILDKETGIPIFDRYIIKRAGGGGFLFFRSGGVRVGVFSVADPDLIYSADRLVKNYYDIIDPRIAALDVVTDLREEGCDIIVALSHQAWDKSIELAREIPGVDIVITSHSSMPTVSSEEVGGVLVVAPGMNTTSFTEIEVRWAMSGTQLSVTDWGKDLLKIEDHPEFLELEEEYKEKTGKTGKVRVIE